MDKNPLILVGQLLNSKKRKWPKPKMPEQQWKDLYLCKTLNDLIDRSKIEGIDKLKTTNTKSLISSLETLQKKVEEWEKKNDMEQLYICLSRFMELFIFLQKTRKSEKEFFEKLFKTVVHNYMNRLQNITMQLESRYLKVTEDRGDILPQVEKSIDKETDDIEEKRLKKSEKETIRVITKAITCSELKSYSSDKKTILLLDVRSAERFQKAKINLEGVKSINVGPPKEIIYTTTNISHSFDDQSDEKELWTKRTTFDLVVIVDETIDGSALTSSNGGKLFKTLSEYEYPVKYKCLKYLDGGFKEWKHKYPSLCTNPIKEKDTWEFTTKCDPFFEAFHQIKYPNLDEPASVHKPIKPPSASASSNATAPSPVNNIPPQLPSPVTTTANKQVPAINRQTKPSLIGKTVPKPTEFLNQNGHGHASEVEINSDAITDKENIEPESVNISNTIKSNNILVDRTNKPSGLKSIQNVKDKENQIAKQVSSSSNEWNRGSVGTSFEPLKSESSSSMKRSSSFPNISNLGGDDDEFEMSSTASPAPSAATPPKYDRAAKPTSSQQQLQQLKPYGHMAADKPRAATDAHDTGIVVSNNCPGLTGLKNLGNTCYMNSIVQCLSNTVELRKDICRFQKDGGGGLKANNNSNSNKSLGSVALELAKVVRKLWAGKHKNFPCDELKNVVGKLKASFRGFEQQDSHEFFTILLDWLHEDLNEPEPNRALLGASEETGERAWGEFRRKNNSIVMNLFYGQLKSTVTCSQCGKQSVTFEPFSNLSLLLPNEHPDSCTLDECLELYLKEESIAGWNCPNCKTAKAATKKIDISKLPPILVIHLKRFTSNGARKKQTFVDFPLDCLDMVRYTAPGTEQRHRTYHLYAVSNHYGTMESGHYTAYCLNAELNRWYRFDDTEVNEMQPTNVRTPAAYILFYSAKKDR